jgi:hypothetical protein
MIARFRLGMLLFLFCLVINFVTQAQPEYRLKLVNKEKADRRITVMPGQRIRMVLSNQEEIKGKIARFDRDGLFIKERHYNLNDIRSMFWKK